MTTIEWTRGPNGEKGESWNPVVGCTRVSAGCDHCYAMNVAHRNLTPDHVGLTKLRPKDAARPGIDWNGTVRFLPLALSRPLSWVRPRRVFVNSMSDLFHNGVTNEQIAAVYGIMPARPQHTFLVLTKRIDRGRDWYRWLAAHQTGELGGPQMEPDFVLYRHAWGEIKRPFVRTAWPLPNVHLGVSAEDQATADERIPILVGDIPAAVRWVSYEPALGPIDFTRRLNYRPWIDDLDWIVVGGESGHGARPFDVAWARSVIVQGRAAGVPVFVKQLGSVVHDRNDVGFGGDDAESWPEGTETRPLTDRAYQGAPVRVLLRDRKGGDPSEWPPDLRVREYPRCA